MTTIASDLRKICTDSSVNDGDQVWHEAKAERVGNGIYGMAGNAVDASKFMTWIRRGKRGGKPKVEEDFCALELTPDGLFLYDEKLHPMRITQPYAIGSGAKAARAAMVCGKTVEEAVEIACDIDSGSRTPIQVYALTEEKK
jgi:ATP-dependent protease HslVU (ClpYQ) peptidase subunit